MYLLKIIRKNLQNLKRPNFSPALLWFLYAVAQCWSLFLVVHSYHVIAYPEPTKWSVRPAKTQISLGIPSVWSESSLSAWWNIGSLASHWALSEDSDQTGRMPKLIWVLTWRTGHFCRTCFSMGDLGVQISVRLSVRSSVRPFVRPSTFTLGVLWAQFLLQFCTDHLETLQVFSSWYEDVHVFGYSC